jgi:hypothetical protein
VDTLQQAVAVVAVAVFAFNVDDGGDAVAAVAKSVAKKCDCQRNLTAGIHPVQLVPHPMDGEPYC